MYFLPFVGKHYHHLANGTMAGRSLREGEGPVLGAPLFYGQILRHNWNMTDTHRALSTLSEEEILLRETAYEYAKRIVEPQRSEMDRSAKMPRAVIDGLFELGLMGIEIPERFGGAEASFFDAVIVVEALAQVDASVSVLLDVQNTLVINTLLRSASDEQKERYLPKLASSWVGSYALSEASSGSDAFALKTKATKIGDDLVLSGEKLWITNADESEFFIVFATVNPELKHKGIVACLVERSAEGFSVGAKEDKLGIRASSTCPLVLEDVRVPRENVLGEIGQGYKIAMDTLNEGRIGIGAQMVGIAQGAFDLACAHVGERKQFGRFLRDFQGVQFQLAEMRTELETARLLVYNAARLKDAGQPFLTEAAMAKLHASRVAESLASQAVDLLGGVGFTREYAAEKFYRDAKIGKIYEGTSNMQLLTIAKQLLS
jgi:alkylation response protein AidB-like acyl-CoA dehydrogenase